MDKRQKLKNKMDLLQKMTVANGASLNEQEVAKQKIKQLSAQLFAMPLVERELETEHYFKMEFVELAMANRKKWKVR